MIFFFFANRYLMVNYEVEMVRLLLYLVTLFLSVPLVYLRK